VRAWAISCSLVDEAAEAGVDAEAEELALAQIEPVLSGPQGELPGGGRRVGDLQAYGGDPAVPRIVGEGRHADRHRVRARARRDGERLLAVIQRRRVRGHQTAGRQVQRPGGVRGDAHRPVADRPLGAVGEQLLDPPGLQRPGRLPRPGAGADRQRVRRRVGDVGAAVAGHLE
jgi:hypothetical protein